MLVVNSGLYWRGGALLPDVTEPGIYFYTPFLTTYANVQVCILFVRLCGLLIASQLTKRTTVDYIANRYGHQYSLRNQWWCDDLL
jgi:hypothetical protein